MHNLAGVALNQGYRVTLGHSKLVLLKQAEDVLTMDQSGRASVQVRHDVRQERTTIEARREERLERLPVERPSTSLPSIPYEHTGSALNRGCSTPPPTNRLHPDIELYSTLSLLLLNPNSPDPLPPSTISPDLRSGNPLPSPNPPINPDLPTSHPTPQHHP